MAFTTNNFGGDFFVSFFWFAFFCFLSFVCLVYLKKNEIK